MPLQGVEIATDMEESEERQQLLARMDELAKGRDQRMEILNLIREKQISVTEAVERFALMKEDT